jgi:choice-of-anchor B domain-containing protein
MELAAFVPLAVFGAQRANDIWGWTDPLTGLEYAILGVRNGTAFFRLNDHGHPTYLGSLPTRSVDSSWRDMKVYGSFVFIVSEAFAHGMQIFDLTKLRDVEVDPVIFASDFDYLSFGSAHNIAINEDSGYAYAVGTKQCDGGLYMIDVWNPLTPLFAGCFSQDGYTHDTQCVIYHGPDQDFVGREICFNSNEDTLTIVDVTDKTAPVMLSRSPYFSSRYTHQGWLTEDHRFFLLDDELDELGDGLQTRTFVWNVQNLRAPVLRGAHQAESTAIDHNQYIVGNHVFQANYRSGIRILRLGDLEQAELAEVAYFDTSPIDDRPIFAGTWSVYPYFKSGFIIASDVNKGLFVLKPDLEAVPECDDGIDNDRDGARDFGEDTTCISPESASESLRLDVDFTFRPERLEHRHPDRRSQRRPIRVVILGSETVDVSEIDQDSLRFGPDEAPPLDHRPQGKRRRFRDVDRDGHLDLAVEFRIGDLGWTDADHEICLNGLLSEDVFSTCASLNEEPSDLSP